MSPCAWCEEATGELVVPGKRGAYVHPSCEAKRAGRRSFLLGAAVLAGAAAAAPLLELVPEVLATVRPGGTTTLLADPQEMLAGQWVYYVHPAQYAALIEADTIERVREAATTLGEPTPMPLDAIRLVPDPFCPPNHIYGHRRINGLRQDVATDLRLLNARLA